MGGIFISYRREDSRHPAGRLYDRLLQSYRKDLLFMDVDAIEPGADFHDVIGEKVASCDVMLVVIGPQWLGVRDEGGNRRLDRPNDFVRLEIEAALETNTRLIPVLVDGASMPREDSLPASLQPMTRRNAFRLTHERFGNDAQILSDSLRPYVTSARRRWLPWGRKSANAAVLPRAAPPPASVAAFVEDEPPRPVPVEAPRTDPRRRQPVIPPRPTPAPIQDSPKSKTTEVPSFDRTSHGSEPDVTRPRAPEIDQDLGANPPVLQPAARADPLPAIKPEPLPEGRVISAREVVAMREREAERVGQRQVPHSDSRPQPGAARPSRGGSLGGIIMIALATLMLALIIGRTMEWFDPVAGVTRLFRADPPSVPDAKKGVPAKFDSRTKAKLPETVPVEQPRKAQPPAPPAPTPPPKATPTPPSTPPFNDTPPEQEGPPSEPGQSPKPPGQGRPVPPQGPRTQAPNQPPVPPPQARQPNVERPVDLDPPQLTEPPATPPRDKNRSQPDAPQKLVDAPCKPEPRTGRAFPNFFVCYQACEELSRGISARDRNVAAGRCLSYCDSLCDAR